jgi:hypothetical protein
MPINTDLNISPYHDDYNAGKKYYRILFKPSTAVQARELTQLQTMLQMQIERFGNNIFKEGSIVEGCTFTELSNLKYVKVGDGINPVSYIDRTEYDNNNNPIEYYYEIEGSTTGLTAYIVNGSKGYISKDPDLNTFYINYLGTTTINGVEQKTFIAGETLLIKEYKVIQQTINNEVVPK